MLTHFIIPFSFHFSEPQPVIKQIPVGYFRTYTYQPLAFNPQTPNHYFSYQAASTVKTFPAAAPPQKTVVQQFGVSGSTAPSALTFNNAASHLANKLGSATTNVQPSIQQPPDMQQQYQPAEHQSLPSPVTSNANPPINAEILSNPHHEDLQQQPPSTVQHHQFRQYPMPEQHLNLQYYAANVAPVPMQQQIQFVPCMCPVSLTLPTEMTANKRVDEQPLPLGNTIATGIDSRDGVETFEA